MEEFKKLGLKEEIIKVLEELKYKIPSEIQEKTIPPILKGDDVIGIAATGSGKTFAFAAGILHSVIPGKGVQALVLTPTRELADQISKVTRNFAKNSNLRVQEIYGGVNFERQVFGLKDSEIIIGTPGRILDHIGRKTLNLSQIKILVLDEADRMVDMGFLPDVEKILRETPKSKQTLLFSATTSSDISYMEKKYMKSPKHITVEQYIDSSKLKQVYYDVPPSLKFSLLVHLLKEERSGIVMVFCNTRRNVDSLTMNLKRYKIDAHAIHGGLDQNKRNRIMEQFHKNKAEILVCTDVAARGLDISGVSHVYNYDASQKPDEYIHRVGRTARAGKDGMAISLIAPKDFPNFRRILENPDLHIEEAPLPIVDKLNVIFQDDRRSNTRGRPSNNRFGNRSRPQGSGNRSSGRPSSRFGGARPSRPSSGGNRPRTGNRFNKSRPAERRRSTTRRSDDNSSRSKHRSNSKPRFGSRPQGRSFSRNKRR